MRILILSDIHANLTAFDAVLRQAEGQWDYVWCLGDVIGYGPDPNECLDRLRQLPHHCLLGNHDWAAIHSEEIRHFNDDARASLLWTQAELREDNAEYLRQLPATLVVANFTLAHGSPREPIWEYIMEPHAAASNFSHFQTNYCLVGHTHMPIIFECAAGAGALPQMGHAGQPRCLNGRRLILNPGSVGQPRDANPDAAYALLDTESERWQQKRAPYAVHEVQQRMRERQLPERLIQRLAYGW